MAKYTVTVRDRRPKPLNIIPITHMIETSASTKFFRATDNTTMFGAPTGFVVESVNGKPIPNEIAVTHHGEVVGFLVRDIDQPEDFELNIVED